ncbi:uncharacterized protein BCR38DRAFT_496783 [Pseudomassariella vexata]|uniref:histidine kinase n=1 Tax=Pseudomassariella vexata TaxID=1141098 RepID=A0A1Y2DP03_9PEZI|nr:uncharacterized protein BCR38DRAFT_496783 [Pseudomassariella vexata]ORY60866.1 hypothetical protein BCR38DRAFT_496783 [Pseudomassariella vexata]
MSKVSEAAREREVFKFASHLHELTDTHQQTTSTLSDAGLTAFAQLTTIRLNAARCLISVFDRNNQYIVAESTPSLALAPNVEQPDNVWLGGTVIPRSAGICEHVLMLTDACPQGSEISTSLPVSVVPDLGEDPRFSDRSCIRNAPYNRFYAGVPIVSPRGINIGVLSVLDNKPRDALEQEQIVFLQDMSRTLIGYLESKRSNDSSRRSERMVRGIGSFVEGKSTMSRWWLSINSGSFETAGAEGALNHRQQQIQHVHEMRENIMDDSVAIGPQLKPLQSSASIPQLARAEDEQATSNRSDTGNTSPSPPTTIRSGLSNNMSTALPTASTLSRPTPEDLHLKDTKSIFGRAANVIRESIEVEGVLFLDASIGSFGGLVPSHHRRDSNPSGAVPSGSSSEETLDEALEDSECNNCNVFGFSTSDRSSIDDGTSTYQVSIPEKFLRMLLRRYPLGKIFNFDKNGDVQSGDSEEEQTISTWKRSNEGTASLSAATSGQNEGKYIVTIFPGARSVVLVPLWDSHKERWFAGAFIWTKTPARTFTMEGEVSYLRAFGNTIMAEVNRLDTVQSDKAKSDLLGSLSHELRSPLHGIVAAVELLHDTEIDAFQGDVIHSMESCGRTLLDVLDHLLDYSKINRFIKVSKEQSKQNRQKSFQSQITTLLSDVELDSLAEESIESTYTGYNFQKMSIAQVVEKGKKYHYDVKAMRHMDTILAVETFGHQKGEAGLMQMTIGEVSIYLDFDASQSWQCYTQPGALRRVIMNILGNSLKYTERGFIVISLRQEQHSGKGNRRRSNLKLTITDSGKGMGDEFLRNHIFTPFAQEDALNPGTGVGLSTVQQIVRTLNGSVTVESQLGRGTSISATIPFPASKHHAVVVDTLFVDHVTALTGLRVSLRGLKENDGVEALPGHSAPSEVALMESLCRDWLHLEVVPAEQTDIRPDLIICSDRWLERVLANDQSQILPPMMVICRNAIAAYKLSTSYKSSKRQDVLEFISQPAGPRKVAKSLVLALGRWNDFKANIPLSSESSGSVTQTPFFSSAFPPLPVHDPLCNVAESDNANTPSASVNPELATHEPEEDNMSTAEPKIELLRHRNSSDNSPKRTKYLLVDDNKINLQILASLMRKLNHSFKTASNGMEALESYVNQPGRYCCVLMADISMPVMDGLESTRRIREFERTQRLAPVTIFALTGLASASTQKEAFASGIDLFMTKPVRLKQLAAALTEKGHG